jgi:hypothetical protein
MSTQQDTHSEQYRRARTEFESLELEDRAVFLLEATVATVARGLDELGRLVARQLDDLFKTPPFGEERPQPGDTPPGSETVPPAEPSVN